MILLLSFLRTIRFKKALECSQKYSGDLNAGPVRHSNGRPLFSIRMAICILNQKLEKGSEKHPNVRLFVQILVGQIVADANIGLFFNYWTNLWLILVKLIVESQCMIAQMVEQLLRTRRTRVQIPAPAPYEITF